MFPNLRDILIYDSNVSDFEGCPHGHRFRPDRHRADPREGGLRDVDEDRTDRRIVSAVRGVRPDREGRGRFLRGDRSRRHIEDPVNRRREGDEDPRPGRVLTHGCPANQRQTKLAYRSSYVCSLRPSPPATYRCSVTKLLTEIASRSHPPYREWKMSPDACPASVWEAARWKATLRSTQPRSPQSRP